MEALPKTRKFDRWHEAMVNEEIWTRWFLAGFVESDVMLSRSALAHIDMTTSKQRRLLGSFNRTDEVAVPVPASAVTAILSEGHLLSVAEAEAVVVLGEFRRYESNPCAGAGDNRSVQILTNFTRWQMRSSILKLGVSCSKFMWNISE